MGIPAAAQPQNDDGFSLIEAAIAAMLLAVFVAALGGSVSTASNSLVDNRRRTQAVAVSTEEMEFMRSLLWTELAMSSIDPTAPMLNAPATALLGSAVGLPTDELLYTSVAGLVASSQVHSSEGVEYTAWRYVTEAGDDLRRAVVLVEWDVKGETRSLQSTTLVSGITAGSGSVTTTTAPDDGDDGDDDDDGDDGDDDDDKGAPGDKCITYFFNFSDDSSITDPGTDPGWPHVNHTTYIDAECHPTGKTVIVAGGGVSHEAPLGTMTLHISCSADFDSGYATKDDPVAGVDTGWYVESWGITKWKYDKDGVLQVDKQCGSNPGPTP